MGYYSEKLAGDRLKACYDIAPPRVRQYLDAEVEHVLTHIRPGDRVLELGCGYGRILPRLVARAGTVVGIDTAQGSLRLGRDTLCGLPGCTLLAMDATALGFRDGVFDCVVCIQNGISAFGVDPVTLIREALRVTADCGIVLFSSYSDRFWKHRLKWFELQAGAGLVGEIDHDRTGDGVIVCRDGFRAATISTAQFEAQMRGLGVSGRIVEVDGSSLFCEIAHGG